MSERQLLDLVETVSRACERQFAARGFLSPMWHAVTADGEHIINGAPHEDKDLSVAMICALFELADVVRYVYIDEAWTVRTTSNAEADEVQRTGAKNHPRRREVVLITGEDCECRQVVARRDIVRPARGKPYLGPLKILRPEQSEGRMVGLLPVKGLRQ